MIGTMQRLMGQLTQPQLDINLDIHHPMSLTYTLFAMYEKNKLDSSTGTYIYILVLTNLHK